MLSQPKRALQTQSQGNPTAAGNQAVQLRENGAKM